jgi:hypothetical protein
MTAEKKKKGDDGGEVEEEDGDHIVDDDGGSKEHEEEAEVVEDGEAENGGNDDASGPAKKQTDAPQAPSETTVQPSTVSEKINKHAGCKRKREHGKINVPQHLFKRSKRQRTIQTVTIFKTYRVVFDKREVQDDYTTLPYGHEQCRRACPHHS